MSTQPPEPPTNPPPSTPNPNKEQGLSKFLKDARHQAGKGGDVNVVNIGADAQVDQIAVGRNILQAKINIGALVVPVRFLLVLLVVAAVIAVVVWWFAIPWQMPAGSSVAVVDFGQETSAGTLGVSDSGKRYAEYLASNMSQDAQSFPIKPAPVVWHIAAGFDPVAAFYKQIVPAPVQDETGAQALANQFGAAVVMYGSLETQGDATNLTPRFAVSQAKGEADELSDPQQLGGGIVLTQGNEERLNTYLYPLSRAMLWITKGLKTQLDGDFVQSYSIFSQAEEILRPEAVMPQSLGKEVLYGFLGDSALFLSSCETDARRVFTDPNTPAVNQALDAAEAAFERARVIGEQEGRPYARAYFGLAQVAFQRAQRILFPPDRNTAGQCRIQEVSNATGSEPYEPQFVCPAPLATPPSDAVDRARTVLLDALTKFDTALQIPHPADVSRLDERMRAARANAEVTLAAFDLQQGKPLEAEPRLRAQVTLLEALTKEVDPNDKRALSETYFVLGTAYNYLTNARAMQGDNAAVKPGLVQARDAFSTCMGIIGNPHFQSDRFQKLNILPNCYCAREGVIKTLEQLP